jgi:hypothetical protein
LTGVGAGKHRLTGEQLNSLPETEADATTGRIREAGAEWPRTLTDIGNAERIKRFGRSAILKVGVVNSVKMENCCHFCVL